MFGASTTQDVVVIGGGFYGAAIAIYLTKQRGFKNVVLLERESSLLTRASYNNQARVHNGYHYPRSFTTAYRSQVNLPRFVRDWPQAVKQDFTKLYAIARRNSKVTAKQFKKFTDEIGASIEVAEPRHRSLFDANLIEEVFLVEEYAFDSTKLLEWAKEELSEHGVKVLCKTTAIEINNGKDQTLEVLIQSEGLESNKQLINARHVFNCTYSGLNQFKGDFKGTATKLKQEVTEMALMDMPPALKNVGITVMDGPFFSTMPFPARGLHTLSHVRYTPHLNWNDECGIDPYQKLDIYNKLETRVDRMVRDVSRYIPEIANAKYVDSLYEIKTVLVKNESDDGRPILFEKHPEFTSCYSVLGGKIDNIFDIIEKLDMEFLC
ncbi:MAG TPA: D amino acid oxidase (DAO) family protein [Methylophilaceae bacterium]|nr:D amino acid oxidase (DAO) family protein [Methylophilaceae bacterium]HAJ72010.1 D amino acid oxidase (DAO) family protein [Methylophilaceae bacterium]